MSQVRILDGSPPYLYKNDGLLAQLVEHLTLNQAVAGSIPAQPTIYICGSGSGVEHRLAKARVAGSNPVFRSKKTPVESTGVFVVFNIAFVFVYKDASKKDGYFPSAVCESLKIGGIQSYTERRLE